MGEKLQYSDEELKEFEGIILDTDEIGRLRVERDQQIVSYDFKEIEFLS